MQRINLIVMYPNLRLAMQRINLIVMYPNLTV